jgi:hypothetical protein
MTKIVGLVGVQNALNQLRTAVPKKVERGIKKACLRLQRESMELVPIQFGNLRASAFARVEVVGTSIIGTVGYTADYALIVHENLNAAHGKAFNEKYADKISKKKKSPAARKLYFRPGPNQQAKFLETPARELQDVLANIIVDEANK